MNATELLEEIFKNYGDAGSNISRQMEAHSKNITLLDNALKSQYDKGYVTGRKEAENQIIQNLIKKN